MKTRGWLYWILLAIAGLTIFSGLLQMLATGWELRLLSAEVTDTSKHFFGIVGMFMVLFGGAFLNALVSSTDQPVVVFWCSLQKFGASAAVGLGVLHHIFSPLALLVASFDLFSGILGIWYWRKITTTT
jgi:hypothetical protein